MHADTPAELQRSKTRPLRESRLLGFGPAFGGPSGADVAAASVAPPRLLPPEPVAAENPGPELLPAPGRLHGEGESDPATVLTC